MFPPDQNKNPMPMSMMAPAQQGQEAPDQSMMSEEGAKEPQQSGLRPAADIGFNQEVQNIVLSRIQTMTPEEEKILDAVISPQTVGVFIKILPELKPLFDMMGGGGAAGQGQTPPQQPAAAPAYPGDGTPADEEAGDEDDDEEDNPLTRNGYASRGLVG
jgi:hypothetical protein